jgi:hypothetical protein
MYALLQVYANGWRLIPESKFGAYVCGTGVYGLELTAREYHLLAAGEFVSRKTETIQEAVRVARVYANAAGDDS